MTTPCQERFKFTLVKGSTAFRNVVSSIAAEGAGYLVVVILGGVISGACSGPPRGTAEEVVVVTDSLLTRSGGDELRLIRFLDETGLLHEAWLRRVATSEPGGVPGSVTPMQTVLIVGGVGTGRRAAEIAPCRPGMTVLALDYPYQGERQLTPAQLLLDIFEIHRAATAMPHGVRTAIRFLNQLPDADQRGVLVIGASFGATFVIKGVAGLPRERSVDGRDLGAQGVRAVAILFWGAGLPDMARHRLRENSWLEREIVAWALALVFRDLETERWVSRISPRPLLLINGDDDELISRDSAEKLAAAAGRPMQQIWLPSRHLRPGAEELLEELVSRTLGWLEELEWAAGREGPQADRGNASGWQPSG